MSAEAASAPSDHTASSRGGKPKLEQKSSRALLRSVAANLEVDLFRPEEDSLEEPLNFKHGLFLSKTLRLKGRIKNILYYPGDQAFKVFLSERVFHYSKHNLQQEYALSTEEKGCEEITRLLHAVEHDKYIGVCKQQLVLLDNTFQVVFKVDCDKQITTAAYNQWSGEVITAGVGYLQVLWQLAHVFYVCLGRGLGYCLRR